MAARILASPVHPAPHESLPAPAAAAWGDAGGRRLSHGRTRNRLLHQVLADARAFGGELWVLGGEVLAHGEEALFGAHERREGKGPAEKAEGEEEGGEEGAEEGGDEWEVVGGKGGKQCGEGGDSRGAMVRQNRRSGDFPRLASVSEGHEQEGGADGGVAGGGRRRAHFARSVSDPETSQNPTRSVSDPHGFGVGFKFLLATGSQ